MATDLYYTTQPISRRVDPAGRFYGRIESNALTPEESLRGIMAYKKITAYSESTVLQLLNDLLQGAVELTAIDGKTRTIGQLLRVYMALEGSFNSAVLTPADKASLKVRTQLLKDMKWPVNPTNFSLVARDTGVPVITGVHYSDQQTTEDAFYIGEPCIITGRNLNLVTASGEIALYFLGSAGGGYRVGLDTTYAPSYNALYTAPMTGGPSLFPSGATAPWSGFMQIRRITGTGANDFEVLDSRAVTIYDART